MIYSHSFNSEDFCAAVIAIGIRVSSHSLPTHPNSFPLVSTSSSIILGVHRTCSVFLFNVRFCRRSIFKMYVVLYVRSGSDVWFLPDRIEAWALNCELPPTAPSKQQQAQSEKIQKIKIKWVNSKWKETEGDDSMSWGGETVQRHQMVYWHCGNQNIIYLRFSPRAYRSKCHVSGFPYHSIDSICHIISIKIIFRFPDSSSRNGR